MFLFLVRHAQSNTPNDHWQTPDSELGEIGIKQAKVLCNRSRFSKLDEMFSSHWERSKKTAEIVSKSLGINTHTLDYIHERKQLPNIYGADRQSEISKEYGKEYLKNYDNLDWRFKGKEESIRMVLDRASKLSNYLLENFQDKKVLVISHDIFIRSFISLVLIGSEYTDNTMARTIHSLSINYTGISLLIHNNKNNLWKVNYINDYSHLKHQSKT